MGRGYKGPDAPITWQRKGGGKYTGASKRTQRQTTRKGGMKQRQRQAARRRKGLAPDITNKGCFTIVRDNRQRKRMRYITGLLHDTIQATWS